MMGINDRQYLKIILILAVIALGILLRSYIYFQKVSFFGDEGGLLLNLMEKNYLQLFLPLKYDQQAPPIFLILSKLIYERYGIDELALRFIPFISSIFSLILFYFLCDKIFKNYLTKVVGLFLFAVNYNLIIYSLIFKQYSIEVLFSIILLLGVLTIDFKGLSNKKFVFYTILSILIPWCSYSSVFLIASFVLIFLAYSIHSKNNVFIKRSIFYAVANFLNILVYYFTNLKGPCHSKILSTYWDNMYGFFPDTSEKIFAIMLYIFNVNTTLGRLLVLIAFCLGLYCLYRKNKFVLFSVLLPVGFTLFAGLIHVYPFAERLLLFLIPNFILIFVASLEYVSIRKWFSSLFIIILFAFYYNSSSIYSNFHYYYVNKDSFDQTYIKEYVNELKKEKVATGSIIYLSVTEDGIFDCYKNILKIPDSQIYRETWLKPIESMDKLPHNHSIYFHVFPSSFYTNEDYNARLNWIKHNCLIQKQIKTNHGFFIKCIRK